jgi:sister chromatid cohesion protein DCC1
MHLNKQRRLTIVLQSVTIKGLPDDDAVLCTDSSTFSLRQVNTSNSLVLSTMDDVLDWEVYDDLSSTIELLPCTARVGRLATLLSSTLYTGPENEGTSSDATFYTFDQLLSIVQASRTELETALVEMNAFVLDDYHRCIDPAYLHHMLDGLSTNATILGYDIRCLSLQEAHACLDQDFASVPDPVRLAFLHAFTKDITASSLCLDDYKVCRFLGSIVLETEKVTHKKNHKV